MKTQVWPYGMSKSAVRQDLAAWRRQVGTPLLTRISSRPISIVGLPSTSNLGAYCCVPLFVVLWCIKSEDSSNNHFMIVSDNL